MSTSSLPPETGDEAPIDAEFAPALPKERGEKATANRPGWAAYGLVFFVALASLIIAAASAGFVPGFSPGAGEMQSVKSDLEAVQSSASSGASDLQALSGKVDDLDSRADSLRADRTRTVTEMRAIQSAIETLQADISALQRARVAALAETPDAPDSTENLPDLSAIDARITSLEDALVTQFGRYETSLEALKLRLDALEDQANAEGLTAATNSNNRTEAALALSAIEAAARRGRPFIAAYQQLETAMPTNAAVRSLQAVSAKSVPTLSDLRASFPILKERTLDTEAAATSGTSSWMRSLFGDGIQVRQKDAVTTGDYLNLAEHSLNAGELSETIEHIRSIDSNLQAVFTDWLQSAEDRHLLEETLEALRLTMIAEERP